MRIVRCLAIGLITLAARPAMAADVEAWLDAVVLLTTGPGLCSGVIIDEEGSVATAYHCVASGRRPRVTARDGTSALGEVVATAPRHDLAVVSVPELAGRTPLPLREEAGVLGEEVWALGHPFGLATDQSRALEGVLRWSVTRGVVSAVGTELIQVDAAVNPGNSGGPVVDVSGQIIGITSRKLRADGIGFCAPTEALLELLEDEGRPFPLGGSYGVHVVALLPVSLGRTPSLGVGANLVLRDTFVLQAQGSYALGVNWIAVESGSARWTGAELLGAARARVGRGRFSTSFDLGGGVAIDLGRSGGVVDGQVWTRPEPLTFHPEVFARLEVLGVALRLAEVRTGPGDWDLVVAVETGIGGPLGTF